MANGKEMINELNYRELIEKMPPKKLSQFTALQTYENSITLSKHEKRLDTIEARLPNRPSKRRLSVFTGSIVAFVASLLYAMGSRLSWWD